MMWLDQMIFLLPGLVLAGLATLITQVTFSKYSRYRSVSGMTGAEAARRLLSVQGVRDVSVEPVGGFLTDHYDPITRTLRLSPAVYNSDSLSAVGVACHEAGHAIQHATHFAPLSLRTALVPATQFGSSASYIIFLVGLVIGSLALVKIGIMLFSLVVVFALVTLPVEWDASARAKRLMVTAGIVSPAEQAMAARVLNAAFLTYVASAFTALMTLLYYLLRAGLLGGSRRD